MKNCLWLALLGACTSFDPIDRDVCGNGLLEPGEDCDSDDPRCVSCSVVCSTASDCPSAAYACGVDGLCHAPGGALGQPTTAAGTFGGSELEITDIDHDGVGDVMGLSATSIVVRHGDPAALLGAEESVLTPAQTGPVAFGDLDGDGSLDLTLTTLDGLVSYTSPYGELAPLAVQSVVLDGRTAQPLDLRSTFHIADPVYSGFIADPATGYLFVFAIDFSNPNWDQAGVFAPPCASRGAVAASDFDPAQLQTYQINRDGDGQLDTVIAMTTGAAHRLCVLAFHRNAPGLLGPYPAITVTDITPAGVTAAAKVPLLADLDTDSDRCPGLVDRDGGPQALSWRNGTMGASGCTLAATAAALAPIPDEPAGAEVVGRIPVDPAVALVASDGLVTSDAIYAYLPAGIPIFAPNLRYSAVYHTTRRLAFVVPGRLDADDNVDAVVAAEDSDDLDLLYRVPNQAGFQMLRLDTASAVTTVTLGDYDGNGLTDIAFTERQNDHQRLMVSYGTPDRPLAPVSVGAFPDIISVTRVQTPDSVDYLGLAGDLMVIAPPWPGKTLRRMTLLHGSPQRTMLSYFDPRQEAYKSNTLFRGAIIGRFAPASGTGSFADVVAIAPSSSSTAAVRAWRVPGSTDGLDGTETPGIEVQGVVDCSTTSAASLCLDTARYLAFPRAADQDVVLGVDRGRRAVVIDPWTSLFPLLATPASALVARIPSDAIPRSLRAADVDGDGAAELVAAFAPLTDASPGALIVCRMAGGVPQSCEDLVPEIVEAASAIGEHVARCVDAAPARISLAATAGADIVAVCRGDATSIYRIHRDPAGDRIQRLATMGAQVSAIRAGDVTGDGVDDLVLVAGDAVRSLVVFPQCTSRDASCVAGGGS